MLFGQAEAYASRGGQGMQQAHWEQGAEDGKGAKGQGKGKGKENQAGRPPPLKIGDMVDLWSHSAKAWCRGQIRSREGDNVTIAYQGPAGQTMTKVLHVGHEDLRRCQAKPKARPKRMSQQDDGGSDCSVM